MKHNKNDIIHFLNSAFKKYIDHSFTTKDGYTFIGSMNLNANPTIDKIQHIVDTLSWTDEFEVNEIDVKRGIIDIKYIGENKEVMDQVDDLIEDELLSESGQSRRSYLRNEIDNIVPGGDIDKKIDAIKEIGGFSQVELLSIKKVLKQTLKHWHDSGAKDLPGYVNMVFNKFLKS